ncbi:hypothetical protein O3P69_017259 [Scylla paramamosain]|uniref:Uncharacterized protein n=1 Tax=Scylla paramamosain TaxID=85552 RepID=A0AAW0TWD2_SCYPA
MNSAPKDFVVYSSYNSLLPLISHSTDTGIIVSIHHPSTSNTTAPASSGGKVSHHALNQGSSSLVVSLV